MSMSDTRGAAPRSDINVTPLIDVVLVLLIVFMIVTPVIVRGYQLEVPGESTDGKTARPVPPVVLGISGPDLAVRVAGEPVARGALGARLREIFRDRRGSDRVLFVAAEDGLNYEKVVQVMDAAREGAGRDVRIAIATDPALAKP